MQALWNNPIFYKSRILERREYQRSKSSFWVKQMGLVWCVLVPLAWVAFMAFPEIMDSVASQADFVRLRKALDHLAQMWMTALTFSYFIVLLVAIAIALNGTSSLVTGEREKKTFESLQATMLTPSEIVGGRLLTGLWPVMRELLIVAPLGLALGTLAGFGFQALMGVLLLFSTIGFYGAVGLWCSYCSKNTQFANRMASGLAGSLLVGVPLFSMLFDQEALLRFHPVFASAYLTTEGFGPVISVTAFHLIGATLLYLDTLRRERSAVRI